MTAGLHDRSKAPAVVRLDSISRDYRMGAAQVHALRDITLELAAGEFVVVLGPSGSGKTTLLNLIGALDTQPRPC